MVKFTLMAETKLVNDNEDNDDGAKLKIESSIICHMQKHSINIVK